MWISVSRSSPNGKTWPLRRQYVHLISLSWHLGIWWHLINQVIFAPMAGTWFQFLQRRIVLSNPSTTIAARVALDQFLFAPFGLSVFFAATSLMKGEEPLQKIQESLIPTYKVNLMLWPWVQFVNFTLVPLQYRLLFVNTVNIGMYKNGVKCPFSLSLFGLLNLVSIFLLQVR